MSVPPLSCKQNRNDDFSLRDASYCPPGLVFRTTNLAFFEVEKSIYETFIMKNDIQIIYNKWRGNSRGTGSFRHRTSERLIQLVSASPFLFFLSDSPIGIYGVILATVCVGACGPHRFHPQVVARSWGIHDLRVPHSQHFRLGLALPFKIRALYHQAGLRRPGNNTCTMVENRKKHKQNSHLIILSHEWRSERAVRANEWTDERVNQNFSLYSWLFWPTVICRIHWAKIPSISKSAASYRKSI